MKVLFVPLAACLLVLASLPAVSMASRPPAAAEKKAIKKAFHAKHSRSVARIRQIRVSRLDNRFAVVLFRAAGRKKRAYFKASGAKFKPVRSSKVPAAVRKNLTKPPRRVRSDIRITGAYNATLTQAATCVISSGYYSATVWDRARDVAFRLQVSEYTRPGAYDVREVGTIAQVFVGNRVTYPTYESTFPPQGPKGSAFIHPDRLSGAISAELATQPPEQSPPPSSRVHVSGTWACG